MSIRVLRRAVIAATLALVGCAGVDYDKPEGIRYYRPTTYVVIKPDYERNTATLKFLQGPDTSRAYAIKPYAFMAKNNSLIEFQNGMLSQVSVSTDSTVVPKAIVTAATAIAQKILEEGAAAAKARAKAGGMASLGKAPPPIFLLMMTERGLEQVYLPFDGTTPPATETYLDGAPYPRGKS